MLPSSVTLTLCAVATMAMFQDWYKPLAFALSAMLWALISFALLAVGL